MPTLIIVLYCMCESVEVILFSYTFYSHANEFVIGNYLLFCLHIYVVFSCIPKSELLLMGNIYIFLFLCFIKNLLICGTRKGNTI